MFTEDVEKERLMSIDSSKVTQSDRSGASRRTIIKGAAWSVPVLAASIATPMAAASVTEPDREFAIQSNFGAGWYPAQQGSTAAGVYQFDCAHGDKYFNVHGTEPGDVITNITVTHLVSTHWPNQLAFSPLAGSNSSWTNLTYVGDEIVAGVSYKKYETTYTGSVTAVSDITAVPHGFYFQVSSGFYPNGKMITRRSVMVNGQPVYYVGPTGNIVNTNQLNYPRP